MGQMRFHCLPRRAFTLSTWSSLSVWVVLALLLGQSIALAAVPRTPPAAGAIVNATGDAEVRLVETPEWLTAEIAQDLLTGDGLRTGSLGTMALLFADRTQIRVQHNSFLTVKAVAGGPTSGPTVLRLDRGGTWSRAATGGEEVRIETPSATAAIRGTDWSLTVDDRGTTRLVVLDGEIILENAYGMVSVKRGEIAFAEIGKAPTKTILVNPQDREQQIYDLSLISTMNSFFKLTDLPVDERRQARERIEAVAPAERDAGQWLDLTELAFDLGDWETARQALQALDATDARSKGRADQVAGFLAFFDYDFALAEERFASAAEVLAPDRALTALIGRSAALLNLRRSDEAKGLIEEMRKEYETDPRFLLCELVLTAFSADLPGAADQARRLSLRFPDDPAFPGAEGILSIVLGRPEQAREAAERSLALDPGYSIGFQVLGEYQRYYKGNSEMAVETLRRGLSHNDRDNELWAQLGCAYLEMYELRMAEEAFRQGIALRPKFVICLANYAILLLNLNRMDEAETILREIEAIDPGRDFTMALAGRVSLQRDDIPEAEQRLLKATTLNPAWADSSTMLAQTYYQKGEPALARQALDNAARLDPNDPLIPLVGSVIASNLAQADLAVEYAREAIRLYRRRGGEGITGLASTRGGNNTLGAAFLDLGLKPWADYYNDLSFDPYLADSYYYRQLQDKAGFSSLFQGMLQEPLSVSGRNRFVDFYRRPFLDSEIGGSLSWPGNGTGYGGNATIQGFSLAPKPMSYYLYADHNFSPEDRDHADLLTTSFIGGLGIDLTPYDGLLLDVEGLFTEKELPGTLVLPDPDDERDNRLVNAGLGYSHSFSARNIALGMVRIQDGRSTLSNGLPLGSTLSSLDYSLVNHFGPETARFLYEYGLRDMTDPADPNSPILRFGGSGPYLQDTIPDPLDTKDFSRLEVDLRALSLHARHLFSIHSVDFTYGAEFKSYRQEISQDYLGFRRRDPGNGLIVGDRGSIPFPFGDAVPRLFEITQDGEAGSAYLDALWRVNNSLWLWASLFADHADLEGSPPMNRLDPRLGLAWQASSRDWLRLAFREDVRAINLYSLAPVATIGLIPETAYLDSDGRAASYIARWDREWCKHFFTALDLRRQDITGFMNSVPNSFMYYYAEEGRIDQASLSANLWLRGGLGLFAEAIWRDTENRGSGPDQGRSLPLIPERQLDAGIIWIHPLQIRVSLVAHLVDEQPADETGAAMLDSYQTVDFSVTWQPLAKHLELGLAAINLLDHDFEIGQNMPADGRKVMLTAKWRF